MRSFHRLQRRVQDPALRIYKFSVRNNPMQEWRLPHFRHLNFAAIAHRHGIWHPGTSRIQHALQFQSGLVLTAFPATKRGGSPGALERDPADRIAWPHSLRAIAPSFGDCSQHCRQIHPWAHLTF